MIALGGYRPGALAAVISLHSDYYSRAWNFGAAFESKVAAELGAFMQRMDADLDLALFAYDADVLVGSIFIDMTGEAPGIAHLRWFIVADAARGRGLGKQLMQEAMGFCDRAGVETVWLTTFTGLDAARQLYEAHGFRIVSEAPVDQWSGGVREQRLERRLPVRAAG